MGTKLTRRSFITGLAALGSILVLNQLDLKNVPDALLKSKPMIPQQTLQTSTPVSPSYGMVIDLNKCIGCGLCVITCKNENNVPEIADKAREISWMRLFIIKDRGIVTNLPRPCLHCDQPPCVKVCPVKATYKRDDGLVVTDYDRCIGCRYCVTACPYNVRYFNWFRPDFPESSRLNPNVPIRRVGVVEKCTFCIHRLEKAKQKAAAEKRKLKDEELLRLTACATICPVKAINFGDFNDPDSTISQLIKSPRAFKLLEELGTQPKVVYLTDMREKQ